MHFLRLPCRAVMLGLTALVAGPRLPAQTQPETIPTALATAVIGPLMSMVGGNPHFVSGQAPAAWPASLVPSAPVRVLGGATLPALTMAVFVYPVAAERAMDEYAALMKAAGWRAGVMQQGPSPRGRPRSQVFCGDSAFAAFAVVDSLPDRATLDVMLYPTRNGRYSPACDTTSHVLVMRPTVTSDRDRPAFPSLTPPAGMVTSFHGTAMGSFFQDLSLEIETTVSADSLLIHFAKQMVAAGWTLRARNAAYDVVIQTMDHRNDRGEHWIGAISVFRLGGAYEVDVHARRESGK